MADATIERESDQRDGDVVTPSSLRGLVAQGDVGDDVRESPALERSLAVAGTVALPLGLALIGFGWYGAAHTPHVFEQVPYLVSGGLLGLALTIAGGMLYFGSWLAGLSRRERREAEELRSVLLDIRERLEDREGASALAGTTAPEHRVNGRTLLVTPTGSMVHRHDCGVVAGRDDVREVAADETELSPCKLCDPLER